VPDFYTFQAALTRQQIRGMADTASYSQLQVDSLANFCIPIKQCWYQPAGLRNIFTQKKFKATGVVQFWQELSAVEHSVNASRKPFGRTR
jgi:hypothetical protein